MRVIRRVVDGLWGFVALTCVAGLFCGWWVWAVRRPGQVPPDWLDNRWGDFLTTATAIFIYAAMAAAAASLVLCFVERVRYGTQERPRLLVALAMLLTAAICFQLAVALVPAR